MLLSGHILLTIFSLVIAEYYANYSNNVTEIIRYQNSTDLNDAKSEHKNLKNRRRTVLIINSDPILRSPSKKLKTVESLLYEEYGEDGNKMNSYMMYNLNDVSNFFKTYLNTEVCHVRCEDDED